MNARDTATALGVTVEHLEPGARNPDGSVTLGSYTPGTGGTHIRVRGPFLYTLYHELAHAIHDRLQPTDFIIDNLFYLDAIADLVAVTLCLADDECDCEDLPNFQNLSFNNADDPQMEILRALPMVTNVLSYILTFAM